MFLGRRQPSMTAPGPLCLCLCRAAFASDSGQSWLRASRRRRPGSPQPPTRDIRLER